MQIETSRDADRECKDLIGEAYEAAHKEHPDFAGFSGLDALWEKVEEVLARKGSLGMCTTGVEDSQAGDILKEVFEEASQAADEERAVGVPASGSEYVDYQQLWERLCAVLGVQV